MTARLADAAVFARGGAETDPPTDATAYPHREDAAMNLPTADGGSVRAADGGNYERLAAVKAE